MASRPPRQARAYLATPTGYNSREAAESLEAAGFEVFSSPAGSRPATVDELLSAVGEDLDALQAADLVVAMPGSEDLFEVLIAPTLRIPVLDIGEALAASA